MKAISKWFFYLALLPVTIGVCGWQGWSWWSWASAAPVAATNPTEAAEKNAVQIEIPQGTSAQEIGESLKGAGLIRSLDAWNLWTRWQTLTNREGSFQAGAYVLSPTAPLPNLAEKIWRGEVAEQSFTVPEGWSMSQMADYFAEQGFFSRDEFLAAVQQVPRDRYPWLPEGIPHLEGFLYPDTYKLPTGQVTPQLVIDQMLDRFQQIALPIYQQGQGQTPYTLLQWVTLSSIVEKEAVVSVERPQIASVFAKRLRENIALGADPTVEYALGIRQTVDQPLTYAQVQTPSPYNTYMNPGLPPTPISSPGLASLQNSLNPTDTPYLYFVARYDGTHVFSRTLAEHEAAQIAIQDGVAAQNQAKPETAN
ncbi:MAG: endolytic transglycosylase MltG [Oculatellaceae cyanobacterium Prado106]|jgi:UPF0755 protein|nr:endolytic transglycosylase MltG [Oculatellaceae cyanobacterium Prado106]